MEVAFLFVEHLATGRQWDPALLCRVLRTCIRFRQVEGEIDSTAFLSAYLRRELQ